MEGERLNRGQGGYLGKWKRLLDNKEESLLMERERLNRSQGGYLGK